MIDIVTMDISSALKKTFLFESLSPEELKEISSFCKLSTPRKKTLLFSEGDKAEGFFVLSKGKVAVFKMSEEGKEQILHIVDPFQSFAEAAVFSRQSYPASARTLSDSTIIHIPKKHFFQLLRDKPDITPKILHSMSIWLKRLVDVIEDLSTKDVESRFLRYLDGRMAEKGYKREGGIELLLDVEKSVIASKINVTPETFSRMLKRLVDKGVLEVKGNRIKLLKPELLKGEG